MPLTITEALAEIKTIGKRLEKKRQFILNNLGRMDLVKDPFATDGGSSLVLERERQAISDLEQRIVDLRSAIQSINSTTLVTIHGREQSINDWLIWKRDVAPNQRTFLNAIRSQLIAIRADAKKKDLSVVPSGGTVASTTDVVINIDELALANEIEMIEDTLGQLDGQLSLKNATVIVNV